MEFTKGDTNPAGDCGKFAAGISILADGQYKKPWYNRIECYGDTAAHAEELRDQVIGSLGREAALRGELDALRESYESMRDRKNSIVDLQQRLTVAEQRAGELEGLFRDQAAKVGLVISSLEFDERLRGSNPERSTLDFPHAIRILSQVKAALKPAEEQTKSCPNCKVCMGSPDFPENCLINGVKP